MTNCILSFDTAMSACSVCVSRGDEVLAHRFQPMTRGQAEALVPMIEVVLGEAGLNAEDMDLVATTLGPGAFTGVRIGIATARGLALAIGVPVLGLTTTEAIAAAHGDDRPLLVVLDTKRADYYVQLFEPDAGPGAGPAALDANEILSSLPHRTIAVTGDGADRLIAELGPAANRLRRLDGADVADAAVIARLAARRLETGTDPSALPPLQPLYLRPPDVRLPAR